jgi:hypothetical protein
VLAGSIAITVVVGIVLGLAAGALGVIVQGVVVSEVAHAAVAEKLALRALWAKVKPVAWRLIGYSALLLAVVIGAVAAAAFALFGLGFVAFPAAAGLGVVLVLAAIPLVWWLSVKLVLVPSAIILERATIGDAVGRSWRLTRTRFWPILGIQLLLSLIFGGIAQVVTIPFSFLSAAMSTIITPTGDPQIGEIIAIIAGGLLSQAVVLLVQAVATVVQATAAALIYIDCRMRHEGLDLDLLTYVERRDAGATGLADPYLEHIGRVIAPRPVPGAYAPPAYAGTAYGGYPSGPHPAYGGYPAGPQAPQYPAAGGYSAPPQYPASGGYSAPPQAPQYPASAPPYAAAAPAAPPQPPTYAPSPPPASREPADGALPAEPAPTQWAAPSAPTDGSDRESPWA